MSGFIDHKSYIYGHGIVSQNCFAQQFSDLGIKVTLLCSGTCVQIHSVRDDDVQFCIVRDDMQAELNQMVCKKADIINVPENLWGSLFTLKKMTRLSLVKDSKVAESIGNIAVGHTVQVLDPDNSVVCTAKVTFKNSISRLGVGTYFGLQVLNMRENLKAVVEKLSSLRPGTKGFPRGCDIVVTIDKLRPSNYSVSKEKQYCCLDQEYKKQSVKNFCSGDAISSESFKSVIPYSLKDKHSDSCTNERQAFSPDSEANLSHSFLKKINNFGNQLNVVDEADYLDEETPEKGLVKSVELIENPLKVNMEFDSPIGSGTATMDGLEFLKGVPRLNFSGDGFPDLAGPKQERSHRAHYCSAKKSEKPSDGGDEDFNFIETTTVHPVAKNLRTFIEKDSWGFQRCENWGSDEKLGNYRDPPRFPRTNASFEDLGKGSVVELTFEGKPHFGVIRWIGTPADNEEDGEPLLIAGIEMEEEHPSFTDGTFNNKRYFQCNPKKALFAPLSKCRKDSRFSEEPQKQIFSSKINYGQMDCPIVEGTVPPINRKGEIDSICGKNRGIQGHHNSCYLDATLFSMFAFTSVFDSLLYRPPTKSDIPQYTEVQRVLREEIVNPLRKNLYVRADRVMKLRTLLERLSSVSGLTSEEKDPEEFLNSLLAQILKAEPFLKLSSGQEAFHYQLFVEKDERLVLPSVQQLFEQSFVTSGIKLKQVPSCLIIQMPRFGKSFKMYSKILPPQLLDITDIIENSPRQCTVCGKLAEYECKDCFGQQGIGNGLESISFCKTCLDTAHNHHCRSRHNSRALTVPEEFCELQEHCIIPRLYMELFAVVCIETSHYVAFVKCGSGADAPWCFFDSMADRKGEQNGYNIPEMVPCPDLPYWLSEEGAKILNEMRDERHLTEHAKRLFSDAYMCMYQSPDLVMYR